jgi:selenocysteine lyase/cysteine desulfurase
VDDYIAMMGVPTGGAIRVSLGLASTVGDVQRLLDFLEQTYRDRRASSDGLAPRLRC